MRAGDTTQPANRIYIWILSAAGAVLLLGLSLAGEVGTPAVSEQQKAAVPVGSGRIWISALRKGSSVDDLKKEDIRLFIGKEEQTISSLTYNSPGPAYFGLLIDVSGSRKDLLPNAEEKVAPGFFRQVMKPEDQAFIVTIGATAQLALRPTSEPNAIQRGLDMVSAQRKWGPTALYDGIYDASDIGAADAKRRVLVVVSDGQDNESHHSLVEDRDRLRETGTVLVYVCVDAAQYAPLLNHRSHASKSLDPLAELSGGVVYSVSDTHTMERAFQSISSNFRDQYALAFDSTISQSRKPLAIEIKCARHGVTILAPKEY